ncbi:MFS transporter [Maritalea mobilis]|uniref:MFS transporter n=1 Tax=Maritalea mobilis TaxID=483324 RepID=A0A4R6VXC3_9HYPH|nr:MFS transporter [Maritalea mobilis]TDQ67444.1 MFS transporter [Maritalea mobilis]
MGQSPSQIAYDLLTAEDDGRVCKDIPEKACNAKEENFAIHVSSLSMSKMADGLVDPKLILSWLLTSAGAPNAIIGMLVPVREAGALLPQLFTAGYIRNLAQRKFAWALGAFLQGASAAGMALAAFTLEGIALGITILALLAILALSRSICSVAYKDVLGKTVAKSVRGTATGTASSIGAGFVILFAALLAFSGDNKMLVVQIGLATAGILWIVGSLNFLRLAEEKGANEGGGNPLTLAIQNATALKDDKQLMWFIITRALLTATALAPPFLIALGGNSNEGEVFQGLGLLLLASAGAGLISSYIWGRLADKSSRKTLALSGIMGGLALCFSVLASILSWINIWFVLPLLLFALMIAYQGVRLGRSTHLVDMASKDDRAVYTALSNTIIGIVLLAGAAFGIIAELFGPATVIALFALMCFAATVTALMLNEEQK